MVSIKKLPLSKKEGIALARFSGPTLCLPFLNSKSWGPSYFLAQMDRNWQRQRT
jgi:hypothetical protein